MSLALIGSLLGKGAAALWKWLSARSLAELACLGLFLFALVQHFQLLDARHDRDAWRRQFDSEHAGRVADRQSYETAQAKAAALNKVQVQRIERQQQEITDNAENRYNADLARLRAELGRLLAQDQAAEGDPGKPGASPLPDSAGKPDDPAEVSIPASLYVHGAELELQLERLQDWVREQLKVDPNK